MENITKIPVTIVTGFLGAGKTTLIKNIIQNNSEKKIAIIVNEFGDIGVDGEILKSCSIPNCPAENIIELSNGCICCTVADDFIPTVSTLVNMNPQPCHIIIETSGLALPKPLLKAFNWPEISSKITVDSVLTLSDAEAVSSMRFAPSPEAIELQRLEDNSLDHETPLSEVFEDQVNCADIILLTKSDLVDEIKLKKAKDYILKISHRNVPVIPNTNGDIDSSLILDLEMQSEKDMSSRKSHHDRVHDEHDHNDFENFVLVLDQIDDLEVFTKKLKKLLDKNQILRTKGYLAVKNKPMRLLVQAVGSRLRTQFDKMWERNDIKESKLVFIMEKNSLNNQEIKNLFKN